MGRRSAQKKRQKRQRQKLAKKQKRTCTSTPRPLSSPVGQIHQSQATSDYHLTSDKQIRAPPSPTESSFGSPSTPPSPDSDFSFGSPGTPPSPDSDIPFKCCDINRRKSSQIQRIVDIDTDCLTLCYDEYERKVQLDEEDDGVVINKLLKFNQKLADTAKSYRRQYEEGLMEIGKVEQECEQRVQRVRNYYKRILFFNDRVSVMFRKSLESRCH